MNRLTSAPKKGEVLFGVTCICVMLRSMVSTYTTYKLTSILDYAQAGNMNQVVYTSIFSLFLILVAFGLSSLVAILRQRFLTDVDVKERQSIMQNLLNRPLRLQRYKDSAYYITLLTTDCDMYRSNRIGAIFLIWEAAANIATATLMLVYLSPWLFLVGVISTLIPVALQKSLSRVQNQARSDFSEHSQEYMQVLKDCLDGGDTIRETKTTPYFIERFHNANFNSQNSFAKCCILSNVGNQLLYTVASLVSWAGMIVGAILIMNNSFSSAKMIAAVGGFSNFSNSVSNLCEYIVSFRSTKKIAQKLTEEQKYPTINTDQDVETNAAEIAFQHISFEFHDKKLYSDFTYTFAPGGCYAIVGESGSGKSTLLKLLLKYYDNYGGTITLDGKNIRDLSENVIFEKVGIVSQTPYVFNTSLYENITMYRQTPSIDSAEYQQLLNTLKIADLAAMVGSKPLGDFGDRLSGGERQRVALARILIRHKRTILFDEPTASLDPVSGNCINELIFGLKGYTRIVITHDRRQEYLKQFDDVIYISN